LFSFCWVAGLVEASLTPVLNCQGDRQRIN
jgi:hypothetical protein